MINWQPMSTAPLDGTYILVYDGYDVWKAQWDSEESTWFHSDCDLRWKSLFHEPIYWLSISDLLKPLGHL